MVYSRGYIVVAFSTESGVLQSVLTEALLYELPNSELRPYAVNWTELRNLGHGM